MANTLVKELLIEVREEIADVDKKRWTDDRLITLLNAGLKHLVRNARLLKDEKLIILNPGQQIYDLSDIMINLERVEFEDQPVTMSTHDEMDVEDPYWKTEKADEEFPRLDRIIYDKRNRGVIKVYPIPQRLNYLVHSSPYGIITDIETTDDVITFYDDNTLPNDVISTDYFRIYYNQKPTTYTVADATSDTVELPTSDMWDDALRYWISGYALLDNKNEQDVNSGNTKLNLYSGELQNIDSDVSKSFATPKRRTRYNNGFNN